jgi:hypothetical protein
MRRGGGKKEKRKRFIISLKAEMAFIESKNYIELV